MDTLEAYDLGVLYAFGGLHRDWLDALMLALTRLGNLAVLGPLACGVFVLFLLLRQRRYAAGFAALGLGGWAIEWLVKVFVGRPRPQVVWALLDLPAMPDVLGFLGLGPTQPSFPSGHAFNAMVIYTTAGVLIGRLVGRPWLGCIGFVLAVLIGLTRPYLGVHYPIDVLAGWVGGLGLALAGVWVIGEPGTPRPPAAMGTTLAPPVG